MSTLVPNTLCVSLLNQSNLSKREERNPEMDSITQTIHHRNPLNLFLPHHNSSFSKPISSSCLSFKSPSKKTLTIKSHSRPQTLKPFLKSTSIAIATAALLLSRFTYPSIATPISPPTLQPTTTKDTPEEEKETILEDYLDSNPNDPRALKALLEVKIKTTKFEEAFSIIDQLTQLEPSDKQWPLRKALILSYTGGLEQAKAMFEEILLDNPLSIEAYKGLVMVVSQSGEGDLEGVLKRIESAMEKCKRKKEDLREFKLLVGQVWFVQGKYAEALKVYEELVKEEPRDFRSYLYQGIIYTLMRKKDEADKCFEKYRRLVPNEHPYARRYGDVVTKMFSQMPGKQKMGSTS